MKKFIDWYFSKTLAWRKRKLLYEIFADIAFIEKHKKFALAENEEKLRDEMITEGKKEKPDQEKISRLSATIADAGATRRELEALRRTAEDLPKYISML